MSFIAENLNIISTIGSALGLYIFIRKASSKEIYEVKSEISQLKTEVTEIKKGLNHIDHRLSKLEGSFEERGRWESHIISVKEK